MDFYLFDTIKESPVVSGLLTLKQGSREGYFKALAGLLHFIQEEAVTATPLRECLLKASLEHFPYGDLLEHPVLEEYLLQDMETLFQLAFLTDWDWLAQQKALLPLPRKAQPKPSQGEYVQWMERFCAVSSAAGLLPLYKEFFARYADVDEARYSAFRWEAGTLVGLETRDEITFDSLGGLETQKAALVENTAAFLEGKPANHVLLVGSSGSGKSSCVKANLNYFVSQGLKMVELTKEDLPSLSHLMEMLRGKKRHYIIYIDDLSFERADPSYSQLKVALDGQLEPTPRHVLLYATSNRRRLMQESWADRQGAEDVHSHDTLHEKMSLSERFGIRLYFGVLSQKEYFQIVEMMLAPYGIPFTKELGIEAATWAATNNGRSGRTARQFVNDYLASVL